MFCFTQLIIPLRTESNARTKVKLYVTMLPSKLDVWALMKYTKAFNIRVNQKCAHYTNSYLHYIIRHHSFISWQKPNNYSHSNLYKT